jgi:hypothetical protein
MGGAMLLDRLNLSLGPRIAFIARAIKLLGWLQMGILGQ